MGASDAIMKEEIFGPLLPILAVKSMDDAVAFVKEREKPLALYAFTNNKAFVKRLKNELSFGGGVINDALMHAGCPELPFGGVGESGMGAYHSKASFDTFTHRKGMLNYSLGMESLNAIRYPPYSEKKIGWLKWISAKKLPRTSWWSFATAVASTAALTTFLCSLV